jgi:hypothetical protein
MRFVDSRDEGLGNRALLDKVDKLRELGVSATIPLPQVSSGSDKSTPAFPLYF